MPSLFVHDDATADLEDLGDTEPRAAARIIALLQELQTDEDLLDRLTQHDYGYSGTADFRVSKWLAQWNRGKDLWRLKIWDLEDKGLRYRIVYAFLPGKQQYHVLAIVPRDFNYDPNHPLSRRIVLAYDDL